jgi:hypothetical protein
MAAWGEQPKQNDSTGDLSAVVRASAAHGVKRLFKRRKRPLDAYGLWARLGVLQEVLDGMPAVIGHLQEEMKMAVDNDIYVLLEDDQWLSGWVSPKKTTASLKFRKRLERELRKL